jgi:RNA polymerase sigma factor for flagellar operon FliA
MYPCEVDESITQDREALIVEHLPQVRLIARRIHERLPGHVSLDDLISNGTVGLISAIDNFDPKQNVKLKTYAEYRIRGAILDGLRGMDWAPRGRRKLSRQIESAIAASEQRLGRVPTEEEIALELAISVDEYRDWLIDTENLQVGELEFASSSEREGYNLLKYVADSDSRQPLKLLERSALESLLATQISRMPKIERTVLSLYFYEEMSLKEIAQIMDLHVSRISQLKTQAILRLRCVIQKRWPGVSGI